MESRYLYLFLDLASLSIPLAFSFYAKAPFYRQWNYVLPAIALSAVMFILWDAVFTLNGVWGFNEKFLIGVSFISLPLEELLFFVCIPYACLFTYFAMGHLIKRDYFYPFRRTISILLIAILVVTAIFFIGRLYTSVTFFATAAALLWVGVIRPAPWLGRFYMAFLFLLLPFFLVNGALTGLFTPEPVVWYNDNENMGLRLATIPVEDTVYALLMLLVPIALWEETRDTTAKRNHS